MRKLIWILFLVGCSNVPVVEQVIPLQPVPVDHTAEIKKIASQSACAKYSWKNRGVGPSSYFEFIALSFHKEHCAKHAVLPLGSIDKDALAFYGLTPTLKSSYTLVTGLGLRESSGKMCTGKDASASNSSADTAEAGPFQSSYNSMSASSSDPQLKSIYNLYLQKCENTVPCTNAAQAKNYGIGEGVKFQKLSKECPTFAVEYNARLIRVLKNHFGPLKRREAEVIPACGTMLDQVAALGCE